jgi:peroxiredoxin
MQTSRLRTPVASLAALSLALLAGALVFADQPGQNKPDPAAEAAAPKQAPADDAAPAAAPKAAATVAPDAKQVIDQVDAAYAKIQRLELAGTFSADLDAAGQKIKDSKPFSATYAAPNKFRHSMQGDILVGSTGDKAYAYMEERKLYSQSDAPKDKPSLEKLPQPIPQVIQMQNPALMLAVVKSAAAELSSMFTEIRKVADSKLNGDEASYQTLELTLPNRMVVTMLFHPQTHLLRQARTDIKPMLEERGTPDVKNATMLVDYTTVKADAGAAVKDEQFAWAPPQGAKDLADAPQEGAGGATAGAASELEGKPAPAFAIKDLNDKTVSLKDLKGKVVVLDMWATWCPPCRASLPHLDKLYEETKDKDVVIYAVNLQEDKDDVQGFIKQTNLKTPVLLDKDGAVAQAYKANAIPQTIVISKDGNVARVFVGFSGEQSAKDLKQAVEQAQK